MDDQTIDKAVRAFGRALSVGSDHKGAMRAALAAASGTGCVQECSVVVDGVRLHVGLGQDIEDGWVVTTDAGADISQMLTGELFGRVDRAVVAAIENKRGA